MRSRWIWLVVAIALISAGLWWSRARRSDAQPRYRTAAIERGELTASVSATGSVRPVTQVEIGSQVSGTVAARNADYNDRVRAGQVLLQIDPSSFRARAAQAEAAVARAQAALKDADRQFARSKELIHDNYISQADVDAAEVAVEQRRADLAQAKALREVAQVDLANTTIRSPIEGVVIARSIDVGQTVAASLQAPKLFVIANDLAQMQVETNIDEADIGRIQPGLPVEFTVDAFPDATFRGTVAQVRLEPIVQQNVVTYTTVIRTRNDDLRLRPGMTANVSVLVDRRNDVLKAPNAALRFRPQGAPGAGGGGGRRGSATGGASPGSGRRGVSMLLDAVSPRAFAQPPQGARASNPPAGVSGRSRSAVGDAARHPPATSAGREGAPVEPQRPAALASGTLWILRGGKPAPVQVRTGITDGAQTEIVSDQLHEGDPVIVGVEQVARAGQGLQPPPGMGGPQFGRPGGGGRR